MGFVTDHYIPLRLFQFGLDVFVASQLVEAAKDELFLQKRVA